MCDRILQTLRNLDALTALSFIQHILLALCVFVHATPIALDNGRHVCRICRSISPCHSGQHREAIGSPITRGRCGCGAKDVAHGLANERGQARKRGYRDGDGDFDVTPDEDKGPVPEHVVGVGPNDDGVETESRGNDGDKTE